MEIIVILIILGAALGIQSLLYRKWGSKGLSYDARLEENEVYEGEEVLLTEILCNDKHLPLPFIKTEIIAPSCLRFGVEAEESKEKLCYIPSIFSLKGKERCTRTRKIQCAARGVFEIGSRSIFGSDLFGLAGFSKVNKLSESLTVLPTPLNTEDFCPSSRLLSGDILVRRFICEDPFLISGAHEYTGREPMNSIFWNGSARMGRLMALNKDYTTASRLLIVLSFQRSDELQAIAINSVCEVLIKAAAFAIQQGVDSKAEYTLCINVPDDEIRKNGSGKDFQLELLRRLARVEPQYNLPITDYITRQRPEEYTDIILIAPYISQTTSDYLKGRIGTGQSVRVYSTRFEARDEDFFVQIRRGAEESGDGNKSDCNN